MFFMLQVMNENRHCVVAAATNETEVTVPCYLLYCVLPFGIIGEVASQRAGRSGVRIRTGITYFSLLHNVQTGCWMNQPSAQRVLGTFSAEVKRPEYEVDRCLPCSGDVQNDWSYSKAPLMPLCRMQGKRYPCYTFVLINTVVNIQLKAREPNRKLHAMQFFVNGRKCILLCPCLMTGHYAVPVLVLLPVFLGIPELGVKITVDLVAGNLFCTTSYFELTVYVMNTDVAVLYPISLFIVSSNKSITFILI
jgi:hypothetical protein